LGNISILYTNADCFLNKISELKLLLRNLKDKPHIIAITDTNPCFGCQQGRLLLLRAGLCLRSSNGQAAVSPQRRRPTRVLGKALRSSEPITPLLRDLHWLGVPERIQFRLCVLAFRCLNASAPPYLAESVRRTADVEGRRHLRSYTSM